MARRRLYFQPSGAYAVEAVGETHHKDALDALWPSTSARSDVVLLHSALLKPEPDNPVDGLAVAVYVDGRRVGYLSNADLPAFHRSTSTISSESVEYHCSIAIAYFDWQSDAPSVSVELDCTEDFSYSDRNPGITPGRVALPIPSPSVLLKDGYGLIFFSWLPNRTVRLCQPGFPVNIWIKPGTTDVYMYAPGSIGGQGRLGIVDLGVIEACGISDVEQFAPRIYTAGGTALTLYFALPAA